MKIYKKSKKTVMNSKVFHHISSIKKLGEMEYNPKRDAERLEQATLIILFEVCPMRLNPSEILDRIEERNLLHMSEKDFEAYKKSIVYAKVN
jgi:hypothetical protein